MISMLKNDDDGVGGSIDYGDDDGGGNNSAGGNDDEDHSEYRFFLFLNTPAYSCVRHFKQSQWPRDLFPLSPMSCASCAWTQTDISESAS